jgi:hypothetical protein
MAYSHTTGDSFEGSGEWLKEPGSYHALVSDVNESPVDKEGRLREGVAFEATYAVMTGTVDGQRDKTLTDLFYEPRPSDTNEQQERARLKIDRFLLATSLIKPSDKGKDVTVELSEAAGRQIVFKAEKAKTGTYLRTYSDIYHVDDPSVAAIPKDKDGLKLIPPERRWIGANAPKPAAKPSVAKPNPADM